jgi:2-polyprenyl-3-methyl-5-hydroxy-6-metoxy-1,4-benzoquinol methylase
VKQRALRLLDPLLQSATATRLAHVLVKLWTSSVSRLPPAEGLRRMLELDAALQRRIDVLAIDLDDGTHAKHRLTSYHDFFVERVRPGERVLDIGSGKGELAHDLAVRAGARVTGLDFNPGRVEFARRRFRADGLEFVEGDALGWDPPHPFDIVVLSNVLEHIAPRVELLRRLRERAQPRRFLIRVPSRERDWLVPLREELGLDWFGDPTHETEYTEAQLRAELHEAGLEIDDLDQRWGELWASARLPSTASDAASA